MDFDFRDQFGVSEFNDGYNSGVLYSVPYAKQQGVANKVLNVQFCSDETDSFDRALGKQQEGVRHEQLIKVLIADLRRKQNNNPNICRERALLKLEEAYLHLIDKVIATR